MKASLTVTADLSGTPIGNAAPGAGYATDDKAGVWFRCRPETLPGYTLPAGQVLLCYTLDGSFAVIPASTLENIENFKVVRA